MPEHILDRSEILDRSAMISAIRTHDWHSTPAGAIGGWPEPVKHAVRLVLMSQAPMAVLLGREGLALYNDSIRDMFGVHYEGALGRPIERIFPEAATFCRDAIDYCFEGTATRFRDQPLRVFRDGAWMKAWFHLAFTPIADIKGTVSAVFLVASETTARVRAVQKLERAQQRFEIALEACGIVGTWDLDIGTNSLTYDERFARLFGLAERAGRDGISNEQLVRLVHPDDRSLVQNELTRAIAEGGDYRCRYRVLTISGDTRWCYDAGRAVKDGAGVVTRLCGVIVDLTNQISTENALEDSERRFGALVESIPQIVWSTDQSGRHDYFNSRWHEFTGIAPGVADDTVWEGLVHADDWVRVSEHWAQSLVTGQPYDIEYRFRHHSGQHRWLRVMALPVYDTNGSISRWYGTATDIEEAKNLELQREIIAHELDHRIRNLFALVSGLVALSVRDDDAMVPLADRLNRRLTALHKAHELVRKPSAGCNGATSLQSLIQDILEPYRDEKNIQVSGDDVTLDDHLVTPLALIIHELATNCAKYGAWACAGGVLWVSIEDLKDQLKLVWKESGVSGDYARSSGSGFGSKLLDATIQRQLRGTYSREFPPSGLRFEMMMPL